MIVEIHERPTDDVWVLYDIGSSVTVCPHAFQEDFGTKNDKGGPRCEGATEHAVTLGGAREVLVEISENELQVRLNVANVTKPIVSAEALFQAL